MSQRLTGKVAVVTGASKGIGAAIAKHLAAEGASVVVNYSSSKEGADRVVKEITGKGGKAIAVQANVSKQKDIERLFAEAKKVYGKLDILVNNAGIGGVAGPLHQLAPDEWDRVLNTNLRGVYYCIRSLAPIMIKSGSGHIINISSLAGKNALPNGAAYAASKWGLNGLTYSVAEELRAHNIRVSVICPGSVHTEFSLHPGKNAEKMLQASDVAHAVAMIVTQAPQSFASEILLRPTQKP